MKLILSLSPKDLTNIVDKNIETVKRFKGGFLFSYLAIRKNPEILDRLIELKKLNPNLCMMLDSGAHSFIYIFAKKIKKVDMEMGHGLNKDAIDMMKNIGIDKFINEYAMFMHKYKDVFDIFVELDLQAIYGMTTIERWRQLFKSSCGDKLMVVWHGEDEETTDKWCKEYSLIGLGGTKASKDEQGRTKKFIKKIVRKYPDNKFHLFALTSNDLTLYSSLGLYSADSTSWSLGSRFGLFYYFDGGILKSQTKYFLRKDAERSDTVNFLAWTQFGNFLNDIGHYKDNETERNEESVTDSSWSHVSVGKGN